MKNFIATSAHLFFSKNDVQDTRLGESVKPLSIDEISEGIDCAILGYPDDEGIKINGGRTGSALAPEKIREFLYKMTPPHKTSTALRFADIGDLKTDTALGERHQVAQETTLALYNLNSRVLSLGGGHDYGFPDAAAFCDHHLNAGRRPLILNFDAHLDVRPTDKGLNSGTPFYRLLSAYKNKIDFVEIGIQPQCNSPHHRRWAVDNSAVIFDLQNIENNGGLNFLFTQKPFLSLSKETPVFISFDVDAITAAEGGGCSQAWTTGLKTQDYLNFFRRLSALCSIKGLGIYEVSPPLDIDNRTSKLAALLAYYFLFQKDLA